MVFTLVDVPFTQIPAELPGPLTPFFSRVIAPLAVVEPIILPLPTEPIFTLPATTAIPFQAPALAPVMLPELDVVKLKPEIMLFSTVVAAPVVVLWFIIMP